MSEEKKAKTPFGGKRRETFDLGEMLASSRPAAAKQGILMAPDIAAAGVVAPVPQEKAVPTRQTRPIKGRLSRRQAGAERVQLNLDPELIVSSKMRAIQERMSLSDLVEAAIRSFLKS